MIAHQKTLMLELVSRGLIGAECQWVQMTGGQTNCVWRVTGDHEDLVCKLFVDCAANPMFANEPLAEFDCLTALAPHKIAPQPKAFLETSVGAVVLYHYVAGDAWRDGVTEVAEIIQRLHRISPIGGLRILSTAPADVAAHTQTILNGISGGLAERILLSRPPLVTLPEISPVLLHTDVVPGNLIASPDGLKLIDWQCPAVGDPVVDMAMFISPAMHMIYAQQVLSQDQQFTFLASFSTELQDRYAALAPLYHWRMAAYCAWKAERGIAGYGDAAEIELAFLLGDCDV